MAAPRGKKVFQPTLEWDEAPTGTVPGARAVQKASRTINDALSRFAANKCMDGYELPKSASGYASLRIRLTPAEQRILTSRTAAYDAMMSVKWATVYAQMCAITAAIVAAMVTYAYVRPPNPWDVLLDHAYYGSMSFMAVVLMLCVLAAVSAWCQATRLHRAAYRIVNALWTVMPFMLRWGPVLAPTITAVIGGWWAWSYVTALKTATWEYMEPTVCFVFPQFYACQREWLAVRIIKGIWAIGLLIFHIITTSYILLPLIAAGLAYVFILGLWPESECWYLTLKVEAQVYHSVTGQVRRAGQESTNEQAVAATPIVTMADNMTRTIHRAWNPLKAVKYDHVVALICAVTADNRVLFVDEDDVPDDPPPLETPAAEGPIEQHGTEGAKRILWARQNTAPLKQLRPGVKVRRKTDEQIQLGLERGDRPNIPGRDGHVPEVSGLVVGPELFDISAGLASSPENEIAGVTRHLHGLRSKVTNELLKPVSEEARARLDAAAGLLKSVLIYTAVNNIVDCLDWSLPKRWGVNTKITKREQMMHAMVRAWSCVGAFLTSLPGVPQLRGFVKRGELGLPFDKLPRLIGNPGMTESAKQAATIGVLENLVKRFHGHLFTKGLSQEQLEKRFEKFASKMYKSWRLHSIDMSAMDSSWNDDDRRRIVNLIRDVLLQFVDVLEGLLGSDFVLEHIEAGQYIRWYLEHIVVDIPALRGILFSGERFTSLGNRLLMLVLFIAFIIEYETEPEKKVAAMFRCPNPIGLTEHQTGQSVEVYDHDYMFDEDDPWEDINMGDGDDSSFKAPETWWPTSTDMRLAFEQYGKLVEPCSAITETVDMECLSLSMIHCGRKGYVFIPNVKRACQRLVAITVNVKVVHHASLTTLLDAIHVPTVTSDATTFVPTTRMWSLLATDLWQRIRTLRFTPIVRQLARAMFFYAVSKSGMKASVYKDDDRERLGLVDGDVTVDAMVADISRHMACEISGYAMVKATHFSCMAELTKEEIRQQAEAWTNGDAIWSALELTDELCQDVGTLLRSFPLTRRQGELLGLGVRALEHCQLAKPAPVRPDVGDHTAVSPAQGRGGSPSIDVSFVVLRWGDRVLLGREPAHKERAGDLTIPGGKCLEGESFEMAAVREFEEETGLSIDAADLTPWQTVKQGRIVAQVFTLDVSFNIEAGQITRDRLDNLAFLRALDVPYSEVSWLVRSLLTQEGPFQVWRPGLADGRIAGRLEAYPWYACGLNRGAGSLVQGGRPKSNCGMRLPADAAASPPLPPPTDHPDQAGGVDDALPRAATPEAGNPGEVGGVVATVPVNKGPAAGVRASGATILELQKVLGPAPGLELGPAPAVVQQEVSPPVGTAEAARRDPGVELAVVPPNGDKPNVRETPRRSQGKGPNRAGKREPAVNYGPAAAPGGGKGNNDAGGFPEATDPGRQPGGGKQGCPAESSGA